MVKTTSHRTVQISRAAEALRRWLYGRWGRAAAQSVAFSAIWFVMQSAVFAWRGEAFEFHQTLIFSTAMGVTTGFGIATYEAGIIKVGLTRNRYGLLRKKAGLRRKWRYTMGEVERLRSAGSEGQRLYMNTMTDDKLVEQVQRLLDKRGSRLTDLQLRAGDVYREDGIVRIMVHPSRPVHSEEYVGVLAAVESEIDIGDETLLLVPVTD